MSKSQIQNYKFTAIKYFQNEKSVFEIRNVFILKSGLKSENKMYHVIILTGQFYRC